ncbi:hypothetical protein V1508DRAFT_406110 [Lipomyces doorenjongii]|uniref:uncharacterized protein n=1 Tax=Lipomyces doorenjongii TaxID=383834 RepID=UPI0034CD2D34
MLKFPNGTFQVCLVSDRGRLRKLTPHLKQFLCNIIPGPRPEEPLGGLYLNPSVTTRKFLRFPVIATDGPLIPGQYDIVCDSPGGIIWLNDERCLARTYSRTVRFREQVRKRDGQCVITGVVNPVAFIDEWTSFKAAHIFPLSHEALFRSLNYPRSCQNGLLMRSHIHQQFDSMSFSIDPDDDYKITCFRADVDGNYGRSLDPVCRDPMDEKRVVDELLRWHFRQTVLTNMKGNGEPIFEFDFPDDRMETELF